MSEYSTTFREYHALRLRWAMPAILVAGPSIFLMCLSLSFLYGKYDDVLLMAIASVAASAVIFVLAMIVHETFRRLAIAGFTQFTGTDKVIKKGSGIPEALGILVIEAVVISQNWYLWEAGMAKWHSRRCVQAEQYKDALAWADEFVRIVPQHPEAYHNRAVVLMKLGNVKSALLDYSRAADAKPERWENVELMLDKFLEFGETETFWMLYGTVELRDAERAARYLRSHPDVPERPPGVPSPNEPEPKGTDPHESDEPGQLVRRV